MEAILCILACLTVLVLLAGVFLYFLEKKTSEEIIEDLIDEEVEEN